MEEINNARWLVDYWSGKGHAFCPVKKFIFSAHENIVEIKF